MEILKFFKKEELIGTCAQICLIAILLPFIAILFGLILGGQDAAQQDFMSALISYVPFSDQIQGVFLGAELVAFDTTFTKYLSAVYEALMEDVVTAMYVGMWIHAFRIIFKEIIPLKGLPLVQIVAGLLFGAMTLSMIHNSDVVLMSSITMFILLLNVVLTLIFVDKKIWQKVLDLIFIAFESLLVPMISGYVVVFGMVFKGYFTDVSTAVYLILAVTLLMIVYALIQYIIVVKKG